MTATPIDPLTVLPSEIVLRILEFTPIASLASLTAVSKAWHSFIDVTYQDSIYGSESKTAQPRGGSRDFEFLSDNTSFGKVFDGVESWKDLCKRQTLLARNWAAPQPQTRESVLQVGDDPVWRFRADFKRRFFVSTSHAGGFNVTDMDTGRILWRLPSTLYRDEDAVRPFAHLEYQDGMAVFDREGDAVEVWQAGLEGTTRGEFKRIAILNHGCMTRGFQLSHWTLVVVSNEGQGFVYDMTQRPPKLTTHVQIEHGAVGHLDQSADVVIYSMGPRGYHAHSKATGEFLGALQPSLCTDKYHILSPPANAFHPSAARHGPTKRIFPPGPSRTDRLVPIKVEKGPLPPENAANVFHGENEWGAGMLHGNLFVGFSRAGRVFICSDWRKALRNQESFLEQSCLVECESNGSTFDLGGWLSVHNHRLMFEINDLIYVVALDDNNRVQDVDNPARASFSLVSSSKPHFGVPVSFMALYDDAIMTTYTTLGWRHTLPNLPGGVPQQHDGHPRSFRTKTIRIVSLAPDLDPALTADVDKQAEFDDSLDPDQYEPTADELRPPQPGLMQLLSMIWDEFDDHGELVFMDQDDDDSEWEDHDGDDYEDEEHEHEHEHGHEHGHDNGHGQGQGHEGA